MFKRVEHMRKLEGPSEHDPRSVIRYFRRKHRPHGFSTQNLTLRKTFSTKECGLSSGVKVGVNDPMTFQRNVKVTTPVTSNMT